MIALLAVRTSRVSNLFEMLLRLQVKFELFDTVEEMVARLVLKMIA